MSDHDLARIAPTLSPVDRELLMRHYWLRGELTPLRLANALACRPGDQAAGRSSLRPSPTNR